MIIINIGIININTDTNTIIIITNGEIAEKFKLLFLARTRSGIIAP